MSSKPKSEKIGNGVKSRIKVLCRVRPQNEAEISNGNSSTNSFDIQREVISAVEKGSLQVYHFDRILDPLASQQEVFEESAPSLVDGVLNSINGTYLAYGQSGSGKVSLFYHLPFSGILSYSLVIVIYYGRYP